MYNAFVLTYHHWTVTLNYVQLDKLFSTKNVLWTSMECTLFHCKLVLFLSKILRFSSRKPLHRQNSSQGALNRFKKETAYKDPRREPLVAVRTKHWSYLHMSSIWRVLQYNWSPSLCLAVCHIDGSFSWFISLSIPWTNYHLYNQ